MSRTMALFFWACFSIFSLSESLKMVSSRGELYKSKLQHVASNFARSPNRLSTFVSNASKKDDDIILPPVGKGEWADWDSDSYVEEPYEADEEETEDEEDAVVLSKGFDAIIGAKLSPSDSGQWSPLSTGNKGESQGMSAADNWPGWSEEAPYFDEDDTQDDEGNWGRAEGADRPGYGAVSGSSDLWTRQTPAEEPSYPKVPEAVTATAVVPSASTSTSQSIPHLQKADTTDGSRSDTLTLILEMNRQFAAMDAKMTQAQINSDRKIDQLTADLSELRRYLDFIIATPRRG